MTEDEFKKDFLDILQNIRIYLLGIFIVLSIMMCNKSHAQRCDRFGLYKRQDSIWRVKKDSLMLIGDSAIKKWNSDPRHTLLNDTIKVRINDSLSIYKYRTRKKKKQ